MIDNITSKHGLAVARVSAEKSVKLSEIIKSLLNEKLGHTALLEVLEEFEVIDGFGAIPGNSDKRRIATAAFRLSQSYPSSGRQILCSIGSSKDVIALILSHSETFKELQEKTLVALRRDHAMYDLFIENFDGISFDDPEDVNRDE
jgi:hypothetical protein